MDHLSLEVFVEINSYLSPRDWWNFSTCCSYLLPLLDFQPTWRRQLSKLKNTYLAIDDWDLIAMDSLYYGSPELFLILSKKIKDWERVTLAICLVGNFDLFLLAITKFEPDWEKCALDATRAGCKSILIYCQERLSGRKIKGLSSQAVASCSMDMVNYCVDREKLLTNIWKYISIAVNFNFQEFLELLGYLSINRNEWIGECNCNNLDEFKLLQEMCPRSYNQLIHSKFTYRNWENFEYIFWGIGQIDWEDVAFAAVRYGNLHILQFCEDKEKLSWDLMLRFVIRGDHTEMMEYISRKVKKVKWNELLVLAAKAESFHGVKYCELNGATAWKKAHKKLIKNISSYKGKHIIPVHLISYLRERI